MSTTNVNFLDKINAKNPLWTKWFIPFALIAIGLTGVVQIALFGTGSIAGMGFENPAWEYVMFVVQMVATTTLFYGIALFIKRDKRFIFFNIFATALYLINGVVSGLMMEAIKRVVMIVATFIMYYNWNKEDPNNPQPIKYARNKELSWILPIFVALTIGLGFIMQYPAAGTAFGAPTAAIGWFDTLAFTLIVTGTVFGMKKRTEAQLFFLMADVAMIITFSLMGQWTIVASQVFFITLNFFGATFWISEGNKNGKAA